MTRSQARALDWLPADGSWRMSSMGISAALMSLRLVPGGLVEREWRGDVYWWRLTAVGREVAA